MKILGIETSCDESACSIVEDGKKILSSVVSSQIDLHAKTGGVVPEVAAREHLLKILPVLDECILKSGLTWEEIDAVAVTKGPGLISSLIIGTETANVISFVKDKLLIPVHHITGHIYSNWLENYDEIQFPILILTVSGGHNELILMKNHYDFELLGETRDDAAGEAFDKVARLIGLGYPGGPAISKAAKNGNIKAFSFPRVLLEKNSLDFSFSGLKTAVLNEVISYIEKHKLKDSTELPESFKNDISASFQEIVCDILSEKIVMAYQQNPQVKEVHLAGGVSANTRLREMISEKLAKQSGNIVFRFPKEFFYCTDNACMIAASAYFLYKKDPSKFHSKENIIPGTAFKIS